MPYCSLPLECGIHISFFLVNMLVYNVSGATQNKNIPKILSTSEIKCFERYSWLLFAFSELFGCYNRCSVKASELLLSFLFTMIFTIILSMKGSFPVNKTLAVLFYLMLTKLNCDSEIEACNQNKVTKLWKAPLNFKHIRYFHILNWILNYIAYL